VIPRPSAVSRQFVLVIWIVFVDVVEKCLLIDAHGLLDFPEDDLVATLANWNVS